MITLTTAQWQQLTRWARAATTPQRLARRARVILGSAGELGSWPPGMMDCRIDRAAAARWCFRPPPAPWSSRWRVNAPPNYSALDKPFAWTFTRHDLERRLRDPLLQLDSPALLRIAA